MVLDLNEVDRNCQENAPFIEAIYWVVNFCQSAVVRQEKVILCDSFIPNEIWTHFKHNAMGHVSKYGTIVHMYFMYVYLSKYEEKI